MVRTKSWFFFNNNKKKQKERFFLENGRLLLQDQLTSCDGRCNPIRSFTIKELKNATNSFDKHYLTYDGLWSRIYKGSFENRDILIKISGEKSGEKSMKNGIYSKDILTNHDIALSSQLSNHTNILKLLGCCLELPSPALIYDNKGNYQVLSELLYNIVEGDRDAFLSWKNRLRIAHDIAYAIVYLHSAFPTPIIHGNLSAKKVMVNQFGSAKLFGFALSVVIPKGKTKVEGLGIGYTTEFVDPEYQKTGIVTEKLDVYSFGMLLLVLLSGKQSICGKAGNLYFISERGKKRVNEDCIDEIVDSRMIREGVGGNEDDQLKACLKLILRCVKERGEERPEMIEVAKEPRQMNKRGSDNSSTSAMGT